MACLPQPSGRGLISIKMASLSTTSIVQTKAFLHLKVSQEASRQSEGLYCKSAFICHLTTSLLWQIKYAGSNMRLEEPKNTILFETMQNALHSDSRNAPWNLGNAKTYPYASFQK